MNSDSEESSSEEDDENGDWIADLQRIRENEPGQAELRGSGDVDEIQNMTDDAWEQLGRDVSINTHLKYVGLSDNALNDHKISFFFRGLTRSCSVRYLHLPRNGLSPVGVRSMVPFLENANNLMRLELDNNDIQSEGFNTLWRALRNSPIKVLHCDNCDIESIEIDNEQKPKHLSELTFMNNRINADGCRELAKLLQGGDSTLENLDLYCNRIDDDGVAVLVDVLRNNTSLKKLELKQNEGISKHGRISLLNLVNDVSSIKATLQSNHTLQELSLTYPILEEQIIVEYITMATQIFNKEYESNPEAAGRAKVIATQLKSEKRAALAELQGVKHSLYSEVNPLHLPEVLSLLGRHHNQGELYDALKLSIAALISTVNRKQCLQQHMAYHKAKIAEHKASLEAAEAEFAAIEAEEANDAGSIWSDSPHSNKRRRA